MSVTNEAVVDRWQYHVRYGRPKIGKHGHALSMDGRNLMAIGDTLYSYGRHFPLAIAVRDERGRVTHFVLNGDRVSVTTSQHQSMTRRLCDRLARELGGVPIILIPFSALEAAGVAPTDVEPIDVRDDRFETESRSSREAPGRHVMIACPEGRTEVIQREAYGVLDRETGTFFESPSWHGEGSSRRWREWFPDVVREDEHIEHDDKPFPNPPWHRHDPEGWEANYKRFTQASRKVPHRRPVMVPDPNTAYVGRSRWEKATRDNEGVWRWTVQHHFLGDSLFRARVRETVIVKPTAEQEAAHTRLRELVRAVNDLAEHVREEQWAARGIRQADSYYARRRNFADQRVPRPTDMLLWLDVELERLRAERDEAYDAVAALVPKHHTWATRNNDRLVITRRRTRRPYFLSSFDYQESTPLYFLCELPHGARPTTMDEAIDSLKPPEVVAAEARGLRVTRQGDLFAIPTRLTKRQLRRLARHGFEPRLRILGTNHSVTEGVVCKGGAVFGRGIMRHEPDRGRDADHKRQRMSDGKTWHLLVRNTVPRQ